MTTNKTYEIFRNEEDWADWDKHIQHIDTMNGLTAVQKERAKQAFQYLRMSDALGESFFRHNKNHPLYDYITGVASWPRKMKWLIRFAEAMKNLQSANGFSEHVKNVIIKDKAKFTERESVLELAYKFFNVGFRPSFDPKVTVLKPRGITGRLLPFQTTPDLMLIDDEVGEEILIEISALTWGKLKEQASRTYHRIFNLLTTGALWREDLSPRARINRILDDEELDDLVPCIQELINAARANNEFREFVDTDTIEMCIAPILEEGRADKWAEERGIKDIPVQGPSYTPYDSVRLKNIIRKEQNQLPDDKPGIVIITADWSLLLFAHSYEEVTSSLAEVLREFPKLICAAASHTYQSGGEKEYAINYGPHIIIKRATSEELIEETVITINERSKFDIQSSTFVKLCNAFIKG